MMATLRKAVPTRFAYNGGQTAGVTLITLMAMSSILAILYLLLVQRPKAKTFKNTHVFGYVMCLLVANVIQAMGTLINFEWIAKRGVADGFSCALQGGLKQAGNLSASFWSLIVSIHIFLLVFFQIRSNRTTFIAVIVATWIVVLVIILLGRFVIQKDVLGPYFGIAGEWCWITANYQMERIFLECFFAFFTIAISFILYTAILLRVRGSITFSEDKKWMFDFVDQRTHPNLNLVAMNGSMFKLAKKMTWYPVSYTAIMLPMTLIQILELKYSVPFTLTTISGIVFNSMGLVNVILIIYISRAFTRIDKGILPQTFSEQDQDKAWCKGSGGLDMMRHGEIREKYTLDKAQLRVVTVDLPTQPASTYMAPDSWKTSSPGGKRY